MTQAIVELRAANIRQGDRNVLENVDLRIAPGEFVYLVGKTGSGKSSLLKTLYAALPLTSGSATVAGFDLRKTNRRKIPKLRRQLGIVFQDFNLLMDRTVEDTSASSSKRPAGKRAPAPKSGSTRYWKK
jgi:cell division transport system ATP-binding protein